MSKTYQVNINDLDQSFLNDLKSAFAGKVVEITISELATALPEPEVVCLHDFEVDNNLATDPDNVHIDDGSVESFLSSGKKTLIGQNGEKPVGRIVRLKVDEKSVDENRLKWQQLFEEGDILSQTDSPQPDSIKHQRREIISDDLAKVHSESFNDVV